MDVRAIHCFMWDDSVVSLLIANGVEIWVAKRSSIPPMTEQAFAPQPVSVLSALTTDQQRVASPTVPSPAHTPRTQSPDLPVNDYTQLNELILTDDDLLNQTVHFRDVTRRLVHEAIKASSPKKSLSGVTIPEITKEFIKTFQKSERVQERELSESISIGDWTRARGLDWRTVPFVSDALVPSFAGALYKHAEISLNLNLSIKEAVEYAIGFFMDKAIVPTKLLTPPLASQDRVVKFLPILDTELQPNYEFHKLTFQQEIFMDNFMCIALLKAHLSYAITSKTFCHVQTNVRPTSETTFRLGQFPIRMPRPFPSGTEYEYVLHAKLNFSSEISLLFKGYADFVKRVQYSMKISDPFKLDKKIIDAGHILHTGLFSGATVVQGGISDYIPGYKALRKLDQIADNHNHEHMVREVVTEIRSQLNLEEVLQQVKDAASSAEKAGDEFANVIAALRHSIPVFSLFFLIVVWLSFKQGTEEQKAKLRPLIIGICIFLAVSYVSVPNIWKVIQRIRVSVEDEPEMRPAPVQVDNVAVPVNGIELSEDSVATITTLFLMLGFMPPHRTSVTEILKPLASMSRGVRDLIKVAYELFLMGSTKICEFFGLDQKLWGTPSPKFNEWKAEVEVVQSDFVLGKVEISTQSEERMQRLIEIGEALMVDYAKTVHSPLTPLVRQAVQELMKIKLQINAVKLNYKPNKAPAVGVFLFGPTSQGKTEFTKFLERALLQLILEDEEFERYKKFPKNYACTAPADKFWDQVSASTVILKVPEFGQFPPVPGGEDKGDAGTIMMFCDPEPSIVRVAEAQNKGKISIQPSALLVTSNQETLKAPNMESIDALQRRLDVPVRVILKEGIDREKISIDSWHLTLMKPDFGSKGTYSVVGEITANQLIALIVKKIHRAKSMNTDTADAVSAYADEIKKAIESGDLKLLDEFEKFVKPYVPEPLDVTSQARTQTTQSRPYRSAPVLYPYSAVPVQSGRVPGGFYKDQSDRDIVESSETDSIEGDESLIQFDALESGRLPSKMVPTHIGGHSILPSFREEAESALLCSQELTEGIGHANLSTVIREVGPDYTSVHSVSLSSGIQLSEDGTPDFVLSKRGVVHPAKTEKVTSYTHTQVGYDTYYIPDDVPFLHGLAVAYPRLNVMQMTYVEKNGKNTQVRNYSSDEVFEQFGLYVAGFPMKAQAVVEMLTSKFGELTDLTIEKLLTLGEYARLHGAKKIGFCLTLTAITSNSIVEKLKALGECMMTYASKFKNFLYDTVTAACGWIRAHETIVGTALVLLGSYFVYSYFRGSDILVYGVHSGNGNINASREIKNANVSKSQGRLRELARNYKASTQSGFDNARSRLEVCLRNMVPVAVDLGGIRTEIGHAFFLEQRKFLWPEHFFMQAIKLQQDRGIDETDMYLIFTFQGVDTKVLLHHIMPIVEFFPGDPNTRGEPTTKDLALFEVVNKSLCGNFPSVVKHIAVRSDIDTFKGGKDFYNAAIVSPRRIIENIRVYRANISSQDPLLGTNDPRTFVAAYEGSFKPGECGDLLMTGDGKVIGFHTNGNDHYGYSVIFYQEMFTQYLDTIKKTPETVDQGPGDIQMRFFPTTTQGYGPEAHIGTVITYNSELKSSTFVKNSIVPFDGVGKPYIERKTGVTNTHISRYAQARAKYVKLESSAKDEHVRIAMEQVMSDSFAIDPGFKFRRLTFQEAIEGIPTTAFKKIPVHTSAGFPLSALGIKKDDYFFYDKDGKIVYTPKCQELKEEVQRYIDLAMSGAVPIVQFQDTLKNERRPLAKIDKPRLVSVSPLVLTIVTRMFYGSFMEYCNYYAEQIGFAHMLNPMSEDWNNIAFKLRAKGGEDRFGAGDFSGFDAHHQPKYMMFLFEEIMRKYDDPYRAARVAIAENICYSYHHFGSVVEIWDAGMPSGNPLTTPINCFLNRTYFMYWWLCVHSFDPVCLPHFKENMVLYVIGDDNAYGVTEEYREIATEEKIGAIFEQLGQIYTDDKKIGATKQLRRFEDITLAKRSFKFDRELGRYVGPLDLDVVLEIPLWTKRNKYTEIAVDNAGVALRELSLHGKEIYDEWAPRVLEFFRGLNVQASLSWSVQYAVALSSEALL